MSESSVTELASPVRRIPHLLSRILIPKVLIPLALVFILVEGYYAVVRRTNDFDVHLSFGQKFLEGEPYRGGGDGLSFYPLGRCAMNGAVATMGRLPARTVCYAGALLALGYIVMTWLRLAAPTVPLPRELRLTAAALSLAGFFPILLRDFDECGLQLFLLTFLTAAADALARGRKALCGFWVATAIVYKATPLLFLPFLAWKRQWRSLGWTLLFTAVWSMAPAMYLGWDGMIAEQKNWYALNKQILAQQEAYPAIPGVEPPKQQNVSLRAGIARYLITVPPEHLLFIDHPLFFQFGNLTEQTAKRTVAICVLGLGLAVAWRMRRGWGVLTNDRNFAPEWATACLFAALLSPVCWRQHLVVALPLLLMVTSANLIQSTRRRVFFGGTAVAILLLSRRFVIGQELAHVVLSYKLDTLAVLIFCGFALGIPTSLAIHATGSARQANNTTPAPVPKAA